MYDKEYHKKYREEHKDKIKDYYKRYYQKNKAKIDGKIKQWNIDNPEFKKNYYQKNKEMLDAKNKEWRKNNSKRFTELCNNSRRRRVERLKAEGCTNPWAVVSKGEKPKYACNNSQES